MKKAEWQAVYAPQGDALERRVRTTLDGLADRPKRAYPRQALEEKYGFTTDIESFFTCTAEEKDGQTVVTYRANKDVGDFAWKLGDYTVTIRNGQAEASWSNDGDDFSSDVWNTALLARGIARRKAGEEWYEITGTVLKTGTEMRFGRNTA